MLFIGDFVVYVDIVVVCLYISVFSNLSKWGNSCLKKTTPDHSKVIGFISCTLFFLNSYILHSWRVRLKLTRYI